ncbi:MAG: SUMF1/EgtB/PvdO family nonheme iron enzyme [Deltaproteobacteria bacterium]|nr:SUMF1/EgtB/PvdO family nonheme iron enzyme [Deltaproteobacteria bacterium]
MPTEILSSKVLTLVFTDLKGSTSLKAEKGDDIAGQLIARHREYVKRLALTDGGRIIDWAGDGCFLTFETPSAAVLFALHLQQTHQRENDLPQVYVGINMGEVMEHEGPDGKDGPPRVEGLAVDTAARIQSLALPGQILMSSAVFNSARQRLSSSQIDAPMCWEAHGAYLFKDFDDFIPIGEVGIEGTAPLKPPPGNKKVQRAVTTLEENTLGWRPATGLSIPGRPDWILSAHLGTGGFGEIWLAADVNTRLQHVFKFCFQPDRVQGLKREVVLLRLLKESLGDRKDIARVVDWELEHQPYYIESEYTEGGDLKNWAKNQGGLDKVPMKTRLELVAQAVDALNAAHGAGVLHKDIKPGNILIQQTDESEEPHVVLADFGIGLLTDLELLKQQDITTMGLTQTLVGSSSSAGSGTALYMAPELLEGRPPSPQSDIYSLGVLLYQIVIGDLSRALATGWEQNLEDELLREDIVACVDGKPESRLSDPSQLAERLRSIDQRREQLDAETSAREKAQEALLRSQRIKKRLMIAGVIVLLLAITTVFSLLHIRNSKREAMRTWARETAMPEIQKLMEAEDYSAAYNLAKKAQVFIPGDPALKTYMDDATNDINLHTKPEGARVSYKPYKDVEGEWIDLGISPLNKVRVPVGMAQWRLQKEGYQERELACAVLPRKGLAPKSYEIIKSLWGDPLTFQWNLYKKDIVPKGTIGIDGGKFQLALHGLPFNMTGMAMDQFFIDHTEVTNRAYKEFIDSGGYQKSEFWKQQFKKDGQIIPRAEAMKLFVDRTGQPGPATWELGDYPEGQDDYPVSGVSWYEAAAYAEFRGKSLPTIFHWARAAFPIREFLSAISPHIVPQSNLEGIGPAKVGSYPGIGSSGAKDMAGNVREWCWNKSGEKRHCVGGMWRDPSYVFNNTIPIPAWDRSPGNGFRCAVYPEGASPSPKLLREIISGFHDPYSIPAYSKEVFQAMKAMFSYPPMPMNPVVESEKEMGRGWKRETVTIDAAYNKERIILHMDLPTTEKPPFKVVIYFPGGNAWFQPKFTRNPLWEPWDAIPKSGRAFITPVYSGTWERGGGAPDKMVSKNFSNWKSEFLQDLGRTIDYLVTRKDMDTKNIAFLGVSWGGKRGAFLTAFEERIKIMILVAGGIDLPISWPKPMALAEPHVTVPTLMLSGKYDFIFPVESHQKPLFDLIGTPPEHKRHILYDTGHLPLPRAQMLKDIMMWLDKYQGPVIRKGP